jgi:error-prone DNA polymerase
MAAWKKKGGLEQYREKLVKGMTERGYDAAFAETIFQQVRGFASYGFPESHAASFALLVYVSSWLKRWHPAEFLAGLLNASPLGFYTEGELIQDAIRHGVEVRPADVLYSNYDSTLEDIDTKPAVRLGLRLINGMREDVAERIVKARTEAPFLNAEDLCLRARLETPVMKRLAGGDALQSLSGNRRQQMWDAAGLSTPPELLSDAPIREAFLQFVAAPEAHDVIHDYRSFGFTLRSHPLKLLRPRLDGLKLGLRTFGQLEKTRDGTLVRTCGLVKRRQQPETASGVTFVSLEDEDGDTQVIVWKTLRDAQEMVLLNSRLLAIEGVWQSRDGVTSLVAHKMRDWTPMLGRLADSATSRDFR